MLLCEREQMRHQDRASSLFSPLLLANWSPLDLVRRIPVLFAITQSIWSKNRNFYCTGKHRMRFTKISCRHIRGNHICYTSRLYRNENSFCEIDVMKEKKKEEKKIDDPFPISLKRQTLRGEKKNWIANHSARWGIWNIWIIDISHVITKHSTFFTRVYIGLTKN